MFLRLGTILHRILARQGLSLPEPPETARQRAEDAQSLFGVIDGEEVSFEELNRRLADSFARQRAEAGHPHRTERQS